MIHTRLKITENDASTLLPEPDETARTLRSIKTRRAPRVVVVGHAVLLRPPQHRAQNEDVAGREPDDGKLEHVVILLLLDCRHLALRAHLALPVPEGQLHHVRMLRPPKARAAKLPGLRRMVNVDGRRGRRA